MRYDGFIAKRAPRQKLYTPLPHARLVMLYQREVSPPSQSTSEHALPLHPDMIGEDALIPFAVAPPSVRPFRPSSPRRPCSLLLALPLSPFVDLAPAAGSFEQIRFIMSDFGENEEIRIKCFHRKTGRARQVRAERTNRCLRQMISSNTCAAYSECPIASAYLETIWCTRAIPKPYRLAPWYRWYTTGDMPRFSSLSPYEWTAWAGQTEHMGIY